MDEQQLGNLGVSIHAGFPNAAVGSHARTLDLTKLLIRHPSTTFLMRLNSNNWSRYGLFAGDTVVVDRSISPQRQDVVVWCQADDFVMTKLKDVPMNTPTWGTVSSVIHQFKK
ncbi:MAG: S24 family peptidase [Candidatus Saccharimonadales bacterium]